MSKFKTLDPAFSSWRKFLLESADEGEQGPEPMLPASLPAEVVSRNTTSFAFWHHGAGLGRL